MKRRIVVLTAALLLGLFASSCVGTTALGILDDSIPEAALTHLQLRNDLRVILFNNQPVDWGPEGLTKTRTSISLPPGNHTLMIKWTETVKQGGISWMETKTATIEESFLPGHSYRIYQQKIWLLFVTIKNIKFKDVT